MCSEIRGMSLNPLSLFDVCVRSLATSNIKWKPILQLFPPYIMNHVKRSLMEWDKEYMDCPDDIHGLSVEEFVAIMNLEEIPTFVHEGQNHIVFDYFVHMQLFHSPSVRLNYCAACYVSVAKPYKFYSQNKWQDMGWMFFRLKDHWFVYDDKVCEDVLWQPQFWCSRCVTTPLFKIYDYEDCRSEHGYHLRWDPNDDSDSEDGMEYFCYDNIVGNSISDCMYEFLNKDFYD